MTSESLIELGWTEAMMPPDIDRSWRPARVVSVYAARADVWTEGGPRLANIRAKVLRDESVLRGGGIAVGDWALVASVGNSGGDVVVEAILPRRTSFVRQAAGERAEPQAIAANIDRVFVVTDVERDFNVRRLERYLVAIGAGGAEAQIVLTKVDLIDENDSALRSLVEEASALAPTIVTSAKSGRGLVDLQARVTKGMTVALVGSSGVGKSALVNRLLGHEAQLEGEVRQHDRRGRHTTTRRSLFLLPDGGLLIDTPGMRELKPWLPAGVSGSEEIGVAFEDIAGLADTCRYRDCTHGREPGCAVQAAIKDGSLTLDRLESWQKLRYESASTAARKTGNPKLALEKTRRKNR